MGLEHLKRLEHRIFYLLIIPMLFMVAFGRLWILLGLLGMGLIFQIWLYFRYRKINEETQFLNRKKKTFLVGIALCFLIFMINTLIKSP